MFSPVNATNFALNLSNYADGFIAYFIYNFSWQMYNAHVTLTFGFMMMVVMRKKVRITSGETSGRRYVLSNSLLSQNLYWIMAILCDAFWICYLLDRQQHGLSVACSLCLYFMVNRRGIEMRLAIIQPYQII